MLERALAFASGDAWLYGIASLPDQAPGHDLGVLIVVGGPQYRAGSHRQFTLLARDLAAAGMPALRFDYRGMGDSDGQVGGFEHAGADLRAAIDRFQQEAPSVKRVVLWGLCDGATAAALYAPQDGRVAGLALLNPWVRTEQGAARAAVRPYYRARLFEPGLWKKIASGRFDWRAALSSLRRTLAAARGAPAQDGAAAAAAAAPAALPERMYAALTRFDGRILVLLSGADLTAQEFADLDSGPGPWRRLLEAPRVTRHRLDGADHTLSRREWQSQATQWTRAWLGKMQALSRS